MDIFDVFVNIKFLIKRLATQIAQMRPFNQSMHLFMLLQLSSIYKFFVAFSTRQHILSISVMHPVVFAQLLSPGKIPVTMFAFVRSLASMLKRVFTPLNFPVIFAATELALVFRLFGVKGAMAFKIDFRLEGVLTKVTLVGTSRCVNGIAMFGQYEFTNKTFSTWKNIDECWTFLNYRIQNLTYTRHRETPSRLCAASYARPGVPK